MFHNRRAHPDIKKTTQRFTDPKKESHSRLRALRTLLGKNLCAALHAANLLKMDITCDLHAARCLAD